MYSRESKKQALKLAVMKGHVPRELKPCKTVPADLLVCFPSRAHLALMPKQTSSPSRPSDAGKRRATTPSALFKSKTSSEIDEPSSPKVTCAGQIKVRSNSKPRTSPDNKQQKSAHWFESLVFKKDELVQYVSTFRGFRFNLQCLGSVHQDIEGSSDDEEVIDGAEEGSIEERSEFKKWFMMLDEKELLYDREFRGEAVDRHKSLDMGVLGSSEKAVVPPVNALLLMRCRSTPIKGWMKGENKDEDEFETEIAKETWVVGTGMDPFGRSKSWKR